MVLCFTLLVFRYKLNKIILCLENSFYVNIDPHFILLKLEILLINLNYFLFFFSVILNPFCGTLKITFHSNNNGLAIKIEE